MENEKTHKSGFVNIIGNPNVGKSTLMNALTGETLSIITNKAQTTRHRILGIISSEDFQIVLSDTPGIIKPAYKLQESMMEFVSSAFTDADILIYMVETGERDLKDEAFFEKIKNTDVPVLLVINKIDVTTPEKLEESVSYWRETLPKAEIFPVSALEKFGTAQLLNRIVELLPQGPAYYPKEEITDKPERFFVNEIIRQKILLFYNKEIPYSVEVETESFIEQDDIIRIRAIIYVERKTQKGILIGHKGEALKRVGTQARIDMEKFFGKRIFLELFVKVDEGWRNNQKRLVNFGYKQS